MAETLADHTTLRLGGHAAQWLAFDDPADWDALVAEIEHPDQVLTLGGGSNIIAADEDYPGTVVHVSTRGIAHRQLDDTTVEVSAQVGTPLAELVASTVAEGLSGIEYLAGIPGRVGGLLHQNGGAYGQEIGDVVSAVDAYDWQGRRRVRLAADACRFGHRGSVFRRQAGRWAILAVTLRLCVAAHAAPITYAPLARRLDLPLGSQPPLLDAVAAVESDRRARGLALPARGLDARQVGSVFVNPPVTGAQAQAVRDLGGAVHRDANGTVRASAGWLLQHVGYHPRAHVGAGIYCSALRTLTLTAQPGATAASMRAALDTMAARVRDTTSIQLRPEPTIVT